MNGLTIIVLIFVAVIIATAFRERRQRRDSNQLSAGWVRRNSGRLR